MSAARTCLTETHLVFDSFKLPLNGMYPFISDRSVPSDFSINPSLRTSSSIAVNRGTVGVFFVGSAMCLIWGDQLA